MLLGYRLPGTPVVEFPKELLDKLAAKGFEVRRCDNRFMAMAEMVLHESARRQGWHRDPAVLIIVEPDMVSGVNELVESVQRFVKKPVFWSYVSRRSPRMQALQIDGGETKNSEPAMLPGAEPSATVFGVPAITTSREPGSTTFGSPAILTSREPQSTNFGAAAITTARDPQSSRADVTVTRSRGPAPSKLRLTGEPATADASPIRDLGAGSGLLANTDKESSDDKALLSEAELSMLLSPEWKLGRTGEGPTT